MVKHNDDGLAPTASARETLVHRAQHAFQFMEADKAPLLQRALPCLDWQVVGVEEPSHTRSRRLGVGSGPVTISIYLGLLPPPS